MHAEVSRTEPLNHTKSGEIRLIDIFVVLGKYRKLILALPLAAALVSVITALLLPNIYTATARLLPPQQSQSGASALLAQLGGVAGLAAGAAGIKNPSDLYVGMLNSRTVADRLIEKYDLQKTYETDFKEQARKELAKRTVITSGKDGLITIEVEDTDPKRSASITNSYIDELLRLSRTLALTDAAQRRAFFEQQLERAKDNLVKAEIQLKSSLQVNGVVSVDAESRAVVETVARLRAQISAKEIQMGSMGAFFTTTHPEYKRAAEELSSLKIEMAKLENGRADSSGSLKLNAGSPGGIENIKLLRDVKYYQMLYELLAKQFEVARLEEAKEPSIIQVLDPAVEPEQKTKPKRAIIVVLSVLVAIFIAIAAAFLLEFRTRALLSLADRTPR